MEGQELLTKSEFFKDEVLAKSKALRTRPMKCRSHAARAGVSRVSSHRLVHKSLILEVHDELMTHRSRKRRMNSTAKPPSVRKVKELSTSQSTLD